MKYFIKSVLFIAFFIVALASNAQKGMGESNGVSRQHLNPELQKLEGTIAEIKFGPCKYTTGKSDSGTHLFVKTPEGLINVHLGPTSEVSNLLSAKEGDFIAMTVFRTNKLPKDEYIAKEIIVDGKSSVLRDETLRPVWAGKYAKERWRKGH